MKEDTGLNVFEELVERCGEMMWVAPPSQEEVTEDDLLIRVWRDEWEVVLGMLNRMPGPISREATGKCLCHAIHTAPPDVFTALLDWLPQGEYVKQAVYGIDWLSSGDGRQACDYELVVTGTLVMYAAAENKPEHLLALLERGHDVNSASPAAAAALAELETGSVVRYGTDFCPIHPFTAHPQSRLYLRQRGDTYDRVLYHLDLEGATPLAAALLLGHETCAKLLVEHGAWLQESPGVSQAMWYGWRKPDADYQAACAQVLSRNGTEHRPVLWALGRTCSPRQLKEVLETWTYAKEERSRAARKMLIDFHYQDDIWREKKRGWEDLCHRLWLLERGCPEALCAPEVIGELVQRCFEENERTLRPFLPVLEGKTLDLTQLPAHFFMMCGETERSILNTLFEHCVCVMDRDGVPADTKAGMLRQLIKHVTFLPPSVPSGVSGLTRAILGTGSTRLIDQALKGGVIPPEETVEELLCCQRDLGLPSTCRALLLTVPRPAASGAPGGRRLSRVACSRWFRKRVPENMTSLMEAGDWNQWFYPLLYATDVNGSCQVQAVGEDWTLSWGFTALCMMGKQEAVEHWLAYDTEELWNISEACCEKRDFHVVMTPVCAAALAGHTEIVRLLLEHGAWAAEELSGFPSVWTRWDTPNSRAIPMTPLAAALLGRHWDTARLLLDRGALCRLRTPELRELWHKLYEGDPEDTVAPDLGAYLSRDGVLCKQKEDEA